MKRIFQLICLLLAANCVAACSNTENDAPLGPIGETPAEEDPDAEHIYLWPEGNMPTETNYTVNNGNYQDDPDFRPNMLVSRAGRDGSKGSRNGMPRRSVYVP